MLMSIAGKKMVERPFWGCREMVNKGDTRRVPADKDDVE
jgi:hypothetical protein